MHLNDLRFRKNNMTQQRWTLPYVPGKRLPETSVYLLTSSRTFSAAEEFSYDLQALKRATVVGEVTPGGANFGASFVLGEHMVAFIPIGRAENPVKKNWEGVGVSPDVSVPAEKALDTAYRLALEKARTGPNAVQLATEIDTAIWGTELRLQC